MQDICQIIGAYKNKNIKAIKRDKLGTDFFRVYYHGGGYILHSTKELCKILKKAKAYHPFFKLAKGNTRKAQQAFISAMNDK